ncbi:MAG: transposase [Acholeplasmatales bacterium]|nr:transposase [Acholeplasmatales bacterium]
MINYSNFCRDLKQDLITFLNDTLFNSNVSRPTKKFVLDMLWGLLITGSTKISEIARTLNENMPLIYTEKRLTDGLIKFYLDDNNLIKYNISYLSKSPIMVNVDESDIIKPYGFRFENLTKIHDGSKEGRPKEKGYNVTGIVVIGTNNTILPLVLNIYSDKTNEADKIFNTTKTTNHLNQVFKCTNNKITVVLDRGYDGANYLNPIHKSTNFFVCRCKDNRKYITNKGFESISDICKRIKGKYVASFKSAKNKLILQKFSSIKVRHKDFNYDIWLVIETVNFDNDKRVYITNIDCSSKENCILVLKSYRMRWRIEEFFRFIKGEYSFEKFMVRKLKAINNLAYIISLATTYITHLIITKNKSYYNCLECYKSFKDEYDENNIIKKYGESGLMLYRVKRGIQNILSHCSSMPKVPGRDRSKKKKYYQLSIFEIKD